MLSPEARKVFTTTRWDSREEEGITVIPGEAQLLRCGMLLDSFRVTKEERIICPISGEPLPGWKDERHIWG